MDSRLMILALLIGAAITVGLTIVGQQLVSMLVDRYGLLYLPQRSISTVRMASVSYSSSESPSSEFCNDDECRCDTARSDPSRRRCIVISAVK